jgi:peptidoglycan/xylan/chitin deacetylase (PgdA/CDA1 family)
MRALPVILRRSAALLGYPAARAVDLVLGAGVRILTYHRIIDLPGDRMSVSPERFRRQLECLRREGCRVVSLDALGDPDPETGRPRVALTFDDGYRDWYDYAFPLLAEAGFPGVFFLATGLVEGITALARYRPLPESLRRPLTPEMIKEMAARGMFFESHGISHRELETLDAPARIREYRASAEAIFSWTGRRPRWFAYPRGRPVPEASVELGRAGYTGAVTVRPGSNRPPFDWFALRRTEISADDTIADFRLKLKGAYDAWHRLWQAAGGRDRTPFARGSGETG